jgi:hypothetical protein
MAEFVRVNLHSGGDLATQVQYNFITFLEPRFNLYDIPLVHPDFDVPKLYHVFVDDCDPRFRAKQQGGRGNLDPDRIPECKARLHLHARNQVSVGVGDIDLHSQSPRLRVDRPGSARHLAVVMLVRVASDRNPRLRVTHEKIVCRTLRDVDDTRIG